MENKINITEKLMKIVKHRKTPSVVIKQENSYKQNRKVIGNLAFDSYSSNNED